VGTRFSSARIKWLGHEANHLSPSSAKVKNEWSHTFTPACLHDMHRDNFSFHLYIWLIWYSSYSNETTFEPWTYSVNSIINTPTIYKRPVSWFRQAICLTFINRRIRFNTFSASGHVSKLNQSSSLTTKSFWAARSFSLTNPCSSFDTILFRARSLISSSLCPVKMNILHSSLLTQSCSSFKYYKKNSLSTL